MNHTIRFPSLLRVVVGFGLVGAALLGFAYFATSARADTAPPVISAAVATPTDTTALISWTTDLGATSQVAYGTSSAYTASSTLQSGLVTNHSVTLMGLTPNTTYHYQVLSGNGSTTASTTMSADLMFTTTMTASSTGTGTTTTTGTTTNPDTSMLQQEIAQLQAQVAALQWQVQWLLDHQGNSGGTGTTTMGGSASINQPQPARAGSSVDFGGNNFGSEEHVSVVRNGMQVGSAFTNLAGGFSTGSMPVPNTTGTYTYTFTGLTSGKTAQVTLTVVP